MLCLPTKAARSQTKDDASLSSRASTLVEKKGAFDCSADVKSISSNSTAGTLVAPATQSLAVKSLDIEKGQRRPVATPIRRSCSYREIRKRIKIFGIIAGAILGLWILPNVILGIFSYYSWYIDTFFNSRVSVHIRRTVHTEAAFTAFRWIFTFVAYFFNVGLSVAIFALGHIIAEKGLKLPMCLILFWMIPWTTAALCIVSACFWLPSVMSGHFQAVVFQHGCAIRGWDLDIALQSATATSLSPVALIVGNASISWTARSNDNYTAQLVRHVDNPLRFDFVPFTFAPGSTHPPFSNITYDWQNTTYIAFRPDSTNVTGKFMTNPNLIIPSLNVSTLDDFIPFQRPHYKSCWPATATLIARKSTGLNSSEVLETLTSSPSDNTLMKVCANASPDVMEKMQVSLGVVFIDHFYFSLCVTQNTGSSYMSSSAFPDTSGDDDDDGGDEGGED